jgi:hypothetical protein
MPASAHGTDGLLPFSNPTVMPRAPPPWLPPEDDSNPCPPSATVPTCSFNPLPCLQSTIQPLPTSPTSLPHLPRGEGAAAHPPPSLTRPTARRQQHSYGERLLGYQRVEARRARVSVALSVFLGGGVVGCVIVWAVSLHSNKASSEIGVLLQLWIFPCPCVANGLALNVCSTYRVASE